MINTGAEFVKIETSNLVEAVLRNPKTGVPS